MVSKKFMDNINKNVTKSLKGKLSGPVDIKVMGDPGDQHKGLGDDLKTALIPFRSSTYEAQEYVYIRAPLNDPLVRSLDFVAALLNIKDNTIPGLGTFMAHIPFPCGETYVERMIGLKHRLLPHGLVVLQRQKPKEILDMNMITSRAVQAINNDKKLTNKISLRYSRSIPAKGLSNKIYKIEYDAFNHPMGGFSTIPYKGNTVMVTRDCGGGAKVDKPDYDFRTAFEGFKGVAAYIKQYPQEELHEGKFYIDPPMTILLESTLAQLK